MARSTAVEPATSADLAVPDLAPTPATEVTFEDIAPPTLYIAQRGGSAVDAGLAKFGDLFIAQGADDVEAQVVYEHESPNAGVLFYPLHMYKTWTFSDGENLTSWPFGDGTPPADAPEGVWRTYNFIIFVPDFDDEMPVNFRLNSKSQRPAANKINFVVSRAGDDWHNHAFRVTTKRASSGANKWTVPVVVEAPANPDQVEKAAALKRLILPGLNARAAKAAQAANQPQI